jgi:hypothetical protein
MVDRLEILRSGCPSSDKIIEIGPSHNPVFPKREGWDAYSIDHTSQEGLREKYRGDPAVDPAFIEPVDFIWTGGGLETAVPSEHHGTFDVFVASHVIEHTTDLVAFLGAAATLTKPDGRVVLAVPDKRVCFDYYRPITTIGNVLEAFHQHRTRHSAGTLADHFFHLAVKRGQPGWLRTSQEAATCLFPFATVANAREQGDSVAYVDAHNWVFVPASFELILLCLARLGLTDWQVARSEAAEATEFYVWLKRGGKAAAAARSEEDFCRQRQNLLDTIMLELDDQSRQIPSKMDPRPENLARPDNLEKRLARLQADLNARDSLIAAMRATHAWTIRARLRRILGLGPTIADR